MCLGDDDTHGDDDDDDGDDDDATVTSAQVCLTQRSQSKEGESVMIDSKISSGPARTLYFIKPISAPQRCFMICSRCFFCPQINTRARNQTPCEQHSFRVHQPGPRYQTPCLAMLSLVPARCESDLSTAKSIEVSKDIQKML